MALDKATLTATLTSIFSDVSAKTPAQKAAEIADAIDLYVKTGTVVGVTAGGATLPIT
jgi:leucyl aminopeptidase (aminopeptidase T)